jgi:hypothetical protein
MDVRSKKSRDKHRKFNQLLLTPSQTYRLQIVAVSQSHPS